MGVYVTTQEMIDRFGEAELIRLTDRATPMAGVIVTGVLDSAIRDAGDLIDSHLEGRYSLPLAAVPQILKRTAGTVARYYLHKDGAPEHVRKEFEDAEKLLRSIARGDVALGLSAAGEKPAGADIAQMDSASSVFARDKSKGFI